MNQNVFYTLVAAAAASTPAGGFAAATSVVAYQDATQKTIGAKASDNLTIPGIAKGNYTLKADVELATGETKITVKFGGKTKDVTANGSVTLDPVDIIAAGDVKVEFANAASKGGKVKLTLTLNYDEEATGYNALRNSIYILANDIDEMNDTIAAKAGLVERVTDLSGLAATVTYNLYKEQELFNGVANSKLQTTYNTLQADYTTAMNTAWFNNDTQWIATKRAEVKTKFGKNHDDIEGLVALKNKADSLINAYEAGLTQANAAAYHETNFATKSADIQAAIDAMKTAVDAFDQVSAGGAAAINEIQDYYTAMVRATNKLLADSADNAGYQFADWLENAQSGNDDVTGLNEIADSITKARKELERQAVANEPDLNAIKAFFANFDVTGADVTEQGETFKDVNNIYAYWKGKVAAEYTSTNGYQAHQATIDGLKDDIANVIDTKKNADYEKYLQVYKDSIQDVAAKLNDSIAKLQTQLNDSAAHNVHNVQSLTFDLTGINALKGKFITFSNQAKAAVDGLKDALAKIEFNDTTFANAKKAVAKLESKKAVTGDDKLKGYKPADRLTGYEAWVEQVVADRKAAAQEAYDTLKVGDTYQVVYKDSIDGSRASNDSTLYRAVQKYITEVTAANTIAKYDSVVKAINFLNDTLAKRKAVIEKLDVYTKADNSLANTPYKKQVEEYQAKIDSVKNVLVEALDTVDLRHIEKMKALQDSVDILAVFKDGSDLFPKLKDAESDNTQYAKLIAEKAYASIEKMVRKQETDLKEALLKFVKDYQNMNATAYAVDSTTFVHQNGSVGEKAAALLYGKADGKTAGSFGYVKDSLTALQPKIQSDSIDHSTNPTPTTEQLNTSISKLTADLNELKKLAEALASLNTKAAEYKATFKQNQKNYESFFDAADVTASNFSKTTLEKSYDTVEATLPAVADRDAVINGLVAKITDGSNGKLDEFKTLLDQYHTNGVLLGDSLKKVNDLKSETEDLIAQLKTASQNVNDRKELADSLISLGKHFNGTATIAAPKKAPAKYSDLESKAKEKDQATFKQKLKGFDGEETEYVVTGALKAWNETYEDVFTHLKDSVLKLTLQAAGSPTENTWYKTVSKSIIEKRIKTVWELVDELANDTATVDVNFKKYAQQDVYRQQAQKLWDETNLRIAGTDESSKRDSFLNELSAILQDINALKTDLDTLYEQGKADQFNGNFVSIVERIKSLNDLQSSKYNEAIAADNAAAKKAFDEAVNNIDAAARDANATVAAYKGLRSKALKDVVDQIAEESNKFIDALYKNEYSDSALALSINAQNDFVATPAGQLWDADKAFRDSALTMQDAIRDSLEKFKTRIGQAVVARLSYLGSYNATTKAYTGIPANVLSSDADKVLKTYQFAEWTARFTKTLISDYYGRQDSAANVKPVADYAALIEKAITLRDSSGVKADFLKELDDLLFDNAELGEDPNNGNQIQVVRNQKISDGMAIVFGKLLNERKAEYAEIKPTITDDELAEKYDSLYKATILQADTIYNENTDSLYKVMVDYKNHSSANASVFAYKAIEELVYEFDDPYNNLVKKNANDAASQQRMAEGKTSLQAQLDAAVAYAKKFIGYSGLNAIITEKQDSIDDINPLTMLLDKFITDSTSLSRNIDSLKTIDLINAEEVALYASITTLNDQYNNYAAVDKSTWTVEQKEAYQAKLDSLQLAILELQAAIPDSVAKAKYHTVVDGKVIYSNDSIEVLLALEQKIAKLSGEFSKLNGESQEDIATELEGIIDEAITENKNTFDALDEETQANYQDKYDKLTAELEDLKQAIEDHKAAGDLTYYEEQLNSQIEDVLDQLNDLIESAQNDADAKAANEAKIAERNADVEEMQAKLDKMIEEIETLYGAEKDADGKYASSIQTKVDEALEAIKNAQKEANKGTSGSDTSFEGYQDNLDNSIADIKAEAVKLYFDNIYKNYKEKNLTGYTSDYDYQRSIDYKYRTNTYKPSTKDAINEKHLEINELLTEAYNERYNSTPDYDKVVELIDSVGKLLAELEDLYQSDQLGDIDHSGAVGVTDYNAVIDKLMSGETPDDLDLYDVNGDGKFNIGDAQAIVNIILYGNAVPTSRANTRISESVSLQLVSNEGGVQRYALNLTNANNYAAFQTDVVLPEGMMVVGVNLTDRADNHMLFTSEVEGATRIIASTFEKDGFKGNDGAVVYIDVQGEGQLSMENIVFADNYARTTEFTLSNSEATAIETLKNAAEAAIDKVYNVGGRIMDGLKKGINIIRNTDGTTQKVIKK